jgi:two-component system, cell cycle response regulator DivK
MPRILLVEDNELNRDMLSRRLLKRGYDVSIAENAAQALELARSGGHDLVLMDVGLPDIDGWEVTRRLRQDSATARLPIIALTAHALATDRARAFEVGCDDYETKPVELTSLIDKIELHLGRKERS